MDELRDAFDAFYLYFWGASAIVYLLIQLWILRRQERVLRALREKDLLVMRRILGTLQSASGESALDVRPALRRDQGSR